MKPTVILLLGVLLGLTVAADAGDGRRIRTRHELGLFADVAADTSTRRDGETVVAPGPLRLLPDVTVPFVPGDTRVLAALDFDADGDLDLFVGNTPAQPWPSALLRNDGRGRFEVVHDTGLPPYVTAAARADFNNDGREDLAVVAHDTAYPQAPYKKDRALKLPDSRDLPPLRVTVALFDGSGRAQVRDVVPPRPGGEPESYGLDAADMDGDGLVDLVLITSAAGRREILICRNNGSEFQAGEPLVIDHTDPYDLNPQALGVRDVDGDGDPDAMLVSDTSYFTRASEIHPFWNRAGTLIRGDPLPIDPDSKSGAVGWLDIDGDGHLDLFAGQHDAQGGRNGLYLYGTDGRYTNQGPASGLWAGYATTKGFAWGDLDDDGDPDAVPSRSTAYCSPAPIPVHINDGRGRFGSSYAAFRPPLATSVYAALACDLDGDLDLDLVVGPSLCFADVTSAEESRVRVYRNETDGGHALELKLVGVASNRSALGARVELVHGERRTVSEPGAGSVPGTHLAPLVIHVGLGDAEVLDAAVVRWPSGIEERWNDLAAGRRWELLEGNGVAVKAASARTRR